MGIVFEVKIVFFEAYLIQFLTFDARKFTGSSGEERYSGRRSLSRANQMGSIYHATIIVDEMANVSECASCLE